jgi:UDP-N-acetylglucosamine diphosphorylase/glucosamine-1-phosphate N-acetyltransferase
MRLCLFEDQQVAFLEPLTLTRPAFDLRCGRFALWQRQRAFFAARELGALVRPHLADICRTTHPDVAVNDPGWLRAGPTVLVNARFLPAGNTSPEKMLPHFGVIEDQVAFAVLSKEQSAELVSEPLADCLNRWQKTAPQRPATGWMVNYPWDLVERNADVMVTDWEGRPAKHPNMAIVGPPLVHVEDTATVEPGVVADTSRGGIFIDCEAVVQAFSRIEGPCYIGPGSWVLGAKIRGSSIGPMCRIGGEVEASIVQGFSNKYHDGFLGHSYVGEWVNLAAGTQVSDLRNDYGNVRVTINGEKIDTKLSKVGSFIGDHTKTGLGALFNTGTVVGAFCNLLPAGELMPRVIPSFCAHTRGRLEVRSDWQDLIATAARVTQRRGRELTDAHKAIIKTLFEQTAGQRAEALQRQAGRSS